MALLEYTGSPAIRSGSWEGRAGTALAIEFRSGVPWSEDSAELDIVNPEQVAGLVVLDTWLCNRDRYFRTDQGVRCNIRNVFLAEAEDGLRLLALDQTEVLALSGKTGLGPHLTQIRFCKDERVYGDFPGFQVHLSLPRLAVFLDRLKEITATVVEEIVRPLPDTWMLDRQTRDAIVTAVVDRANFLSGQFRHQFLVDLLQPREA